MQIPLATLKPFVSRHKVKIGAALVTAGGLAAAYYGGPVAGEKAREYLPYVLKGLATLLGL